MLFSLYCTDKPGSLDLRMAQRPDHVAYLESQANLIVFGGPLLLDDTLTPIGSLLIVDVPDRAAADAFSRNDPYTRAGLFSEVVIRPTRKVFPKG